MNQPDHTVTFALLGHGNDGKTSLADATLLVAGVTNRLGRVDDGSSFMNYLPEEQHRRLSISTAVCSFEFGDFSLNLLDAPGDANFAGEAHSALEACDGVVLTLSAQDGVKVGTEKAFVAAAAAGRPACAVANKMDLERADYDRVAGELEQRLGIRVVRLHLPIGQGESFAGYVDLQSRKAHLFAKDGTGSERVEDPPAELGEAVEAACQAMTEAVAEGDDAMLEKYLEQGALSPEEIHATLRKGVRERKLLPLISASASHAIGGQALLDLATRVLPTAQEMPGRAATRKDTAIALAADAHQPLVGIVFKSIADRYAGSLSLLRVLSGSISKDATVLNPRTGSKERIGKLLRLRGEQGEEILNAGPGAIVAIPKLRDTHTGDVLCDEKAPTRVAAGQGPRGVISFAIEATNKGDEDKVFESLGRLVEEDPSLRLGRDPRTGEFLLTGLGQLHIEVALEKLRRLFKVDVTLHPPKVPYMETIRGRAEKVEGKLKKQSGGRGQFGVCYLTVEPGERGSGVQFLDEVVGGAIPRQFIPAVEKGVRETVVSGIVAGFPVTDLVVRCIDGKYHAVDSSEMAFKTAASLGLKAAFVQAKPVLLEPIMDMEIAIPDEFVGDVMGNLNSRRGRVSGVDARGHMQVVRAQAPMAEVLTYASDLTSITGGQGSFTMEFSRYDEVPKEVQDRIIAEAEAAKAAH